MWMKSSKCHCEESRSDDEAIYARKDCFAPSGLAMTMWQRAMAISELPKDSGKSVELAGQSIALFSVDGKVHAVQNHCLHRGGPRGEGYLEGSQVTCPWHAWQFDVKTGECDTMKGAKLKTFKTKIEKNEIWVEI